MNDCLVCLAVENASEETKDALIRRQALTITRLRASVDTFRLAGAQMRIRELEEAMERVNRSNPRGMATEIARELAQIDPRDPDLACFFCFEKGSHRKDCVWHRAAVAAEVIERDEKRRTKKEWAS